MILNNGWPNGRKSSEVLDHINQKSLMSEKENLGNNMLITPCISKCASYPFRLLLSVAGSFVHMILLARFLCNHSICPKFSHQKPNWLPLRLPSIGLEQIILIVLSLKVFVEYARLNKSEDSQTDIWSMLPPVKCKYGSCLKIYARWYSDFYWLP